MNNLTKKCPNCDKTQYYKTKKGLYRAVQLNIKCRKCGQSRKSTFDQKLYNKNYYLKNEEKIKQQVKKYRINNLEKYKEYSKEYYRTNKTKLLKKQKTYYNESDKQKLYRLKNLEKIKNYQKHWRENNKDWIKKYNTENKTKIRNVINKWRTKKYHDDILYKLELLYRNRLNQFLKSSGIRKKTKTTQMLGCSYQQLKLHIEQLFKIGMSWHNYGYYGWHIDHIIPLDSAKNENDLIKLCHYTNLQPLWANENIKKRNKV
jgi:hypothetical protein